jgi:hypothetical protein
MDEDVLAHYPDERERWFRFKDVSGIDALKKVMWIRGKIKLQ